MFGGGFEQFFGGGMPRGAAAPSGPVDNNKYYELLGLDPSASEQDIKKAWKKTAARLHPDRGGDTEKFQEAQHAYEVLSDPQKKSLYDQFGEDAVTGNAAGGGGGHGDMNDILSSFFGGGGQRNQGPPRGRDVGVKIEVTLEDLYLGSDRKLDWERKGLCSSCDGNGGPPEAKSQCSNCDGHGVVVKVIRMGHMIQQQQMRCPNCKGQGYLMKASLMCKNCKGEGIIDEKVALNYTISPGMSNGEKIRLAQEGDRVVKEMIPGDVYVVLETKKHDTFERKGEHLLTKKKISLLEALTGFQFNLPHLDGRVLRIASPLVGAENPVHKVVKPGDLMVVSHEGMPTFRNPLVKGNLVIQFEIEFPDQIVPSGIVSKQDYVNLHRFLPLGKNTHSQHTEWVSEDEVKQIGKNRKSATKEEPIDVLLEPISAEAFANSHQGKKSSRHRNAHDEDDDEEQTHGGTQCKVQ